MTGIRIGDRVGVKKGSLRSYYGHVTRSPKEPITWTNPPVFGVTIEGHRFDKGAPRVGETWYFLSNYLEHVD